MRKNNLFKKTVAAGLVLLMTASLAACDGKKTDTKTEDKKTETKAGKEEDVELCTFVAVFFSAPLFSSSVMKYSLHLNQRSAASTHMV